MNKHAAGAYAPAQDRKGQDLQPGDRVRIRTYPRGTAEGVVVISPRTREVLPDGSTAPALSVDSGGTLYGMPPPKGVLKLAVRTPPPTRATQVNTLRSKVIRLAHTNPELRGHLLPLLKAAASEITEKLIRKLVEKGVGVLEASMLTIPDGGRGFGGISTHFESRPLRGGYGPYEVGTIQIGKFQVRIVGDLSKSTVGIGVMSGPHALGSMSSVGPVKDAAKRLKKTVDSLIANVIIPTLPKPTPPESPFDEIPRKLKGIQLGVAGRARSVEGDSADGWSIEPTNRQRLDHYVGEGYSPDEDEDPEGWDEDGWENEYAGPTRKSALDWLKSTFGSGLFDVDVGEKGHVEVMLTPAGKKHYGV